MENIIKVGVGVLIDNGNSILLGHRIKTIKDTGGIYEPDSWTLPGGKMEYGETVEKCAIRETKEETNLDISNISFFGISDDIEPNKQYVTIQTIANNYSGIPNVMEPDKIDEWRWFNYNELPNEIYSPSEKFIKKYLLSKGR